MTAAAQSETLSFSTETDKLLHLVTNALYSNREIFLRELISNASDASDKLRYLALSDAALYENDPDLKIWVTVDKDSKTVRIRDNGVGMTREEVIDNLGTIASSGTKKFFDQLSDKQAKDPNLIGQFGVGFYSAFMVADKVTVETRKAGMQADQGVRWESDGKSNYTIENLTKDQRGTTIILHLNNESEEFLESYKLRSIIRKYSDHILLPIEMVKQDIRSDEEKAKEPKEIEFETVNQANALWALPKSQVKPEQYKELYKHIGHDFEDPLAWSHNKVEGKLEYTSLLYLPARAPFDLYNREMQRGLKLYVRRVFIMDDAEQLLPMYLRFVRGVVDSNDLPLNVSREILQSNKVIENIKSGCAKRVLSMLEKMSTDDKDDYKKFWKEFGSVLKEGPAEDFANRDRIAKLLRFSSTYTDSETPEVTLDEYVKRMSDKQDKIYYIVADSFTAAKNSPLLEAFRKKGLEVLLMNDRVDEWLMSHLTEFEGKQFQSVSKGTSGIEEESEASKQQKEQQEKDFKKTLELIKDLLGEKVKEVRVSDRLTDSPACVVFDDSDPTGHMQRLMRAAGQELPAAKPILELNTEHALVRPLKNMENKEQLSEWSELLLGQARLAEGEDLEDPAGFVKLMNKLLLA